MSEQTINRERPEVHEDDVAMMSTPIHWESWGEETEGPYAGYAQGVSLGLEVNTWLAQILGTTDFDQRVYDAIAETLEEYKGAEWTNDDGEVLCIEFGLAYAGNETADEMVGRIRRETGFIDLYNDGVILFNFVEKLAKRLGRRRYVNDFEGDGWVDAEDTATPDVYYRNGERDVVYPRGYDGERGN